MENSATYRLQVRFQQAAQLVTIENILYPKKRTHTLE